MSTTKQHITFEVQGIEAGERGTGRWVSYYYHSSLKEAAESIVAMREIDRAAGETEMYRIVKVTETETREVL